MPSILDTRISEKYLLATRSKWKLRAYFLKNLPSAWWWSLTVKYADKSRCEVRIPFNWRTKNPFRSIYFAALAGAGELSTGVLANAARLAGGDVSMLVTQSRMAFVKKANTPTIFTCEDGEIITKIVEEAVRTGESGSVWVTSVGRNSAGEEVARFEIEWSFKARAKQR